MDYRNLGRTGLKVSRIALGCMSYGDPTRGNHSWVMTEEEGRPFIRKALEAGINFFDTANDLATAGAQILSLRTNAANVFTFRGNGNFGNFVGTFGTDATKTLGLATGVAPTSAATDAVQIYSVDIDSKTVLGVYAEKAVSTIYTSDTNITIPIMYNGELYHIATKTAA